MFRDSAFDASNAFALVKPPERRQYYEGSVTGPLGHSKRTSFLLALDDDLLDQQAIVDASALSEAEGLGFGPIPQSVPNPTHHFFGSGRVFHDLDNGDQFWIGYSYEHRSSQDQGVGGTVLPSAATDTHFLEHEINVSYLHQISPHLLHQTRFLVGHYDSVVNSLRPDPQIAVSGLFTAGGAGGFPPHRVSLRRRPLRDLCQREAPDQSRNPGARNQPPPPRGFYHSWGGRYPLERGGF